MVAIVFFMFVVFGALAFLSVIVIGIYNGLVSLRNQFKNAFAQIDVQLKRRYDLIPNLVESTKAYLKHERETLEAVIKSRNQAAIAAQKTSENPANAEAMKSLLNAESSLSGALNRLMAVFESYPDLKADKTVEQLKEELVSTENRIAFARQAYNDSVMMFNTSREKFPNNFISGFFQFQEAPLFEITKMEEKEAPKVSFG